MEEEIKLFLQPFSYIFFILYGGLNVASNWWIEKFGGNGFLFPINTLAIIILVIGIPLAKLKEKLI